MVGPGGDVDGGDRSRGQRVKNPVIGYRLCLIVIDYREEPGTVFDGLGQRAAEEPY